MVTVPQFPGIGCAKIREKDVGDLQDEPRGDTIEYGYSYHAASFQLFKE